MQITSRKYLYIVIGAALRVTKASFVLFYQLLSLIGTGWRDVKASDNYLGEIMLLRTRKS